MAALGRAAWGRTAPDKAVARGKPAWGKTAPGKAASIKIASHLVESLPDDFLLNRAVVDPDALDEAAMARVDSYVHRRANDIREAMRKQRARSQ